MEISDWVSNGISLVFLALVFWELRLGRKQRERDAVFRLHQGTRDLHLEVLHDPELLLIIAGSSQTDQKERRFWQLWLNHIETTFRQRDLFRKNHWSATLVDFREFFEIEGFFDHWVSHEHLYSPDFRKFIHHEVIEKKAEAPPSETSADKEGGKTAQASTT